MSTSQRIVKNTIYLSSAFIGQKILSFVYFTLIARVAGVSDTGSYVFALSFSTIFSVFVDFGLAPYIQREIARYPEKTKEILNKTLGIKLFYVIGAVGFALIVNQLMGLEGVVENMVFIALALMVFDSYNLTIWSAFRGHHQLQFEAFSVIASQTITLLIGITGLVLGAPLEVLIVALLFGSLFTSVYATILARIKLGFFPLPNLKREGDGLVMKESVPFGLSGAFTRVFSSIDSVLLKLIAGPAAVGFYAVPNKIVFALQFIPAAFAASIYPAMSTFYKEDERKMIEVFEQSMLFLLLLSLPLAIGIFVLTPVVITELYSADFSASIPAMYILVWGVIFGFLEFPLGALLNAIGQQKKNTLSRGIVMTVNVFLNLLLIPMYSFVGAAVAALISYALLTILGLIWVKQSVDIHWKKLVRAFVQISIASIIMGGVVFFLIPYVHFSLLALVGMVVFVFLSVFMRIVTIQQLRQLLRLFRKASV